MANQKSLLCLYYQIVGLVHVRIHYSEGFLNIVRAYILKLSFARNVEMADYFPVDGLPKRRETCQI